MGQLFIKTTSIVDNYVVGTSNDNAKSYSEFSDRFGLFETERHVFEQYVSKNAEILDVGCGTGRTSFALFDLGYENLSACDISPHMIAEARQRATQKNYPIDFSTEDARKFGHADASFDIVFFSYNGVMTVPGFKARLKVFTEARRILRPGGKFIFSTYRRDMHKKHEPFWAAEAKRWEMGLQNPALHEFGDIIKTTQIESDSVFVHFPDQQEIDRYLTNSGFRSSECVACVETDPNLSTLINTLEYYILEA